MMTGAAIISSFPIIPLSSPNALAIVPIIDDCCFCPPMIPSSNPPPCFMNSSSFPPPSKSPSLSRIPSSCLLTISNTSLAPCSESAFFINPPRIAPAAFSKSPEVFFSSTPNRPPICFITCPETAPLNMSIKFSIGYSSLFYIGEGEVVLGKVANDSSKYKKLPTRW